MYHISSKKNSNFKIFLKTNVEKSEKKCQVLTMTSARSEVSYCTDREMQFCIQFLQADG